MGANVLCWFNGMGGRRGEPGGAAPAGVGARPPRQCCAGAPTAADRVLARQAMRSAGAISELSTLVLSPRLDGHRHGMPVSDRSEAPCGIPRCPQAYVIGAPFVDEREAEEEATRHMRARPGAVRWFVGLQLREARAVDCRAGALCITERGVREQEPRTLRRLRALREEGADLVWISGTPRDGRAIRVAILFVAAFGGRVEVLGEGPRMLREDGSWSRLQAMSASRPDPEDDRARAADAGPGARRWMRRLLLDLFSALVCSAAAKALVVLAGVRVSVPLWALLAIVFAALIAVRAVVAGGRRQQRESGHAVGDDTRELPLWLQRGLQTEHGLVGSDER